MSDERPRVQWNVRLPPDVLKRLREEAKRRGVTATSIVEDALALEQAMTEELEPETDRILAYALREDMRGAPESQLFVRLVLLGLEASEKKGRKR